MYLWCATRQPLSPLFFLVFINDISKFKSVRVWQYADDMKIALRIKNINDCFQIQYELRELENCAYRISTPISFDYVRIRVRDFRKSY